MPPWTRLFATSVFVVPVPIRMPRLQFCSGRQMVLFTLAEEPPESGLPGVLVYHLPHLVDDIVTPREVA